MLVHMDLRLPFRIISCPVFLVVFEQLVHVVLRALRAYARIPQNRAHPLSAYYAALLRTGRLETPKYR